MKLDLIIPTYNEEEIIFDSITETILNVSSFPYEVEVIVADNGSSDRTTKLAEKAGATILRVPGRGKGFALTYSAGQSTAPLFAFIDADLSAHPRDLVTLHDVLLAQEADIVIGSRLLNTSTTQRGMLRTLSSRFFNILRKVILGIQVKDTQCSIKLMNEKGRMVLASCTETGWFIDMEFLARAERAGLSIVEVPVEWEEFRYPNRKSKLHVLSDGVRSVFAMIRIRSRIR